VQNVETFKAIREIVTYWLLFKEFVVSTRLFFYNLLNIFVEAKTDRHINLVHFFKKRGLVAFSV